MLEREESKNHQAPYDDERSPPKVIAFPAINASLLGSEINNNYIDLRSDYKPHEDRQVPEQNVDDVDEDADGATTPTVDMESNLEKDELKVEAPPASQAITTTEKVA